MMRLIVYLHGVDGFINIRANRIEKDDSFLYAYSGENLIGMFDIGVVMTVYLSEKNG